MYTWHGKQTDLALKPNSTEPWQRMTQLYKAAGLRSTQWHLPPAKCDQIPAVYKDCERTRHDTRLSMRPQKFALSELQHCAQPNYKLYPADRLVHMFHTHICSMVPNVNEAASVAVTIAATSLATKHVARLVGTNSRNADLLFNFICSLASACTPGA